MTPPPAVPEPRAESWALLVIDCQRDFWTPEHAAAFPGFRSSLERLLGAARHHRLPVVHVRSEFSPGGEDWMPPYRRRGTIPCIRGSEGAEVLPFAAPTDGEAVFAKTTFDALRAPGLVGHLRKLGSRGVLVAGLETSYCVLLSAASATQEGLWSVVVTDACADDPAHAALPSPFDLYAGKMFFRSTVVEVERSLVGPAPRTRTPRPRRSL